MGKPIVLQGEVIAIPGQVPYPGAVSGAWTALPVQCKLDNKIKVGGKAAVVGAECKFMFIGVGPAPANNPVNGQETVKLAAKKTTLQKKVLVSGDQQVSSYGNKLQVIAMGKLTTS